MEVRFLLSVIAALFTTADCICSSTTLYATTSLNWKTVYSSSYDYCSINIRPVSYYGSSYYLEISWTSSNFDVKGDMPFCKGDYVEVFLTSSWKSIGKFCSNNADKPFTMYSRDRYAKITHSTNGYPTGSGFKFYYQLKRNSYYPLGGYTSSSTCYNSYNTATSGVIYSTGWPVNYIQSSSSCNFRISRKYGYQGVYVVFMDLNMYSSWYSNDCVQLFASNYSTYYYEKTVSSRLCNPMDMKTYKTYSSYLKITFNRNNKQSSTYRGFVAGYVMFKKPTGTADYTPKTSFNSTSIVLGVVIPIVIIAIIVIAVVVYTKKRQRPSPGIVNHGQPQTATMVSTQQTTTQQTPQNASSVPNANYAFNKTQYVYPTATLQGVSYPQGSYPMSYATGPTYPARQYTTSAYGAPQMSFMVAPTYSSAAVGAMQPPLASGAQGQQASGPLNPSYDGNALPPIESSPNVPPPAYQAATSS